MRAKRISILFAVILVLGLVPNASAAAPRVTPLEKVSNLVQPGIVHMETKWRGRVYDPLYGWLRGGSVFESTATCSGFFVNPDGYFMSAGHCVERQLGREDILRAAARWSFEHERWQAGTTQQDVIHDALHYWKVRSADDSSRHGPSRKVSAAYGVDIGGLPTGEALPARVLGVRGFENGDVALLKIDVDNAPALELADDAGIEVGTEVVSVGFPGSVDLVTDQSSDPSFKEGSISSEKTRNGVRTFEISAAVSEGMSGGPTVNLRGRVIGVNSFAPMGESQAFNFVSSSAEVEALLADLGVENKLGRTNATYREGLAAYYAGDREEALAKFGEVLELVRPHELAQEFRTKALRLPKAPTGGSPLPAIAGGAALVLAILIVVALLVWRRRPSAANPPQPPHAPQPIVAAVPVSSAPAGGNGSVPATPSSVGAGSAPALVATDGPLVGLRVPVAGDLVLGRGMVDVRIDDPQVSWRHASVTPLDGGLVITDLQSLGGTSVNGQRIDGPIRLANGDEIQLGETTMRADIGFTAMQHADTARL